MDISDEIVGPSICSRCRRPFLPAHDTWALCPACGACHAIPYTHVLRDERFDIVRAWTSVITGNPAQLRRSVDGAQVAVHDAYGPRLLEAAEVREARHYSILVERSVRVRKLERIPQGRFCVAAFFVGASREGPSRIVQPGGWLGAASVTIHGWGIELFAEGETLARVLALGFDRLLDGLAGVAAEHGGEPIYSLLSDPSLRAQLAATLPSSTVDRTVRCDRCGAPLALRILAASSACVCPYCAATVVVHAELAHELELHRRRLTAHAAMHALDVGQLWESWRQIEQRKGASWLACAVCGAPNEHTPGALDERCRHCAAVIVPSAAQLSTDAASARSASEALRRRAEERLRARKSATFRSDRVTAIAVGIGFAGVAALSLVMGVFGDLEKRLLSLSMIPFIVIPAIFMLIAWRHARRQRSTWYAVWAALADQLDGRVVDGAGVSAWLAKHWPGRVEHGRPSRARGGVELAIEGMPVLLEGDPEADVGLALTPLDPPWLHAFLAVKWGAAAGVLKDAPGIVGRRQRLARAGFYTALKHGGLLLVAAPNALEQFKRHPATTAMFVPAMYEAARIARLLDAG